MGILLYRVDERLIHGQVVLGWGAQLRPERYVVIDDEIAKADWEQELYRLALPAGPTAPSAEFVSVDHAAERLETWNEETARTVVLLRGLESVLSLAQAGSLHGQTINLGGLHYAPGRKEVLPYLHFAEADVERIRWLDQAGVAIEARDLPSATRMSGQDLVRRGRRLWSG